MKIKGIISICLALCLSFLSVACDTKGSTPAGETKLLSFSQAESVDEMKNFDGKSVSIIGYMSTLSPVSGKFMYLMNLPYQSCPFCVPNTTQLSNTMAVYAKDGDEFKFTDRAIQVTGVLEFGKYTDEFGYEYAYRIKDATYSILDVSSLTDELRLWQQLAATDIIAEVYRMYEYVNFLCFWATYTAKFSDGEDYLYPNDAIHFIEDDGAQFNYGFKDGYFDSIIETIEEVHDEAFADLVKNIKDARALSEKMYNELKAGKYTSVSEYSGGFKDGRSQYKMNIHSEADTEMKRIYKEFSTWLSSWEL